MDKQRERKQTRQKTIPKPLKFNRLFYILGIVFSILIVLGILASITILATKDYQRVSYIFYMQTCPEADLLPNGDLPNDFSYVGCTCIGLSNYT